MKFVIGSEGDGFIKRIIPKDGIGTEFDLNLGGQKKRGFILAVQQNLSIAYQ